MSITNISEVKNPGEVKSFGVDFTNGLDVGDSPATQEVKVYEATTDTDTSSTMLVPASTSRDGNIVTAKFQAGEDGTKYNLRYALTTTGGETLYHFLVLKVKDERV